MGPADTANILFGIPIILYGYLLCLDAYNALGKHKLPKWIEPLFIILFGLIIMFSAFGELSSCQHGGAGCKNNGVLNILFGLFLVFLGIAALLNNSLEVFNLSAAWMTPAVLVVMGILLYTGGDEGEAMDGGHGGHKRMAGMDAAHMAFVSQSFTACALLSAVLRALMMVDAQRWGIFTAYTLSMLGLVMIFQSKSILDSLGNSHMPHTIILALCVLASMMLIPVMGFIHYATKGKLNQFRPLKSDSE